MNPKISVIIPVYNTREYLPFTLRNVVEDQFSAMSADEWELIVVDDGSTDGSHLEVEPWIERYPESVRLIRKENAGVSAARNDGLAAARGEYVYFMDSDDILLRNSLSRLCAYALGDGTDIIKFMRRVISPEEYTEFSASVPESEICAKNGKIMTPKEYIEVSNGLTGPPEHYCTWQSIYRRKFLVDNSLLFSPELSIGEDVCFIWEALFKAHTVYFTPDVVYYYHQREGSLNHDADRKGHTRFLVRRIQLAGQLVDIRRRIINRDLASPEVMKEIDDLIYYLYYYSLTTMIVRGYDLQQVFRAMRLYYKGGGDVHPGRPRFTPYYKSSEQTAGAKLRRIIVAYIFGCIVPLTTRRQNYAER